MGFVIAANRITVATTDIRERVAKLDPVKARKLDSAMALTFDEHWRYQELKSRAMLEGSLSQEEAQLVYVALGESLSATNGGWSSGVDTATKVVLTKLFGELLEREIRARGARVPA